MLKLCNLISCQLFSASAPPYTPLPPAAPNHVRTCSRNLHTNSQMRPWALRRRIAYALTLPLFPKHAHQGQLGLGRTRGGRTWSKIVAGRNDKGNGLRTRDLGHCLRYQALICRTLCSPAPQLHVPSPLVGQQLIRKIQPRSPPPPLTAAASRKVLQMSPLPHPSLLPRSLPLPFSTASVPRSPPSSPMPQSCPVAPNLLPHFPASTLYASNFRVCPCALFTSRKRK